MTARTAPLGCVWGPLIAAIIGCGSNKPTAPATLHFGGAFDNDSVVAVDTAYDVAQHFHFVVADASGDSVGSVPVVNIPSIQWMQRSGQMPSTPPVCVPSTGEVLLTCPASDSYEVAAPFSGYYVVTVQPGSLAGVTNPNYRATFDLNVVPRFPTVHCSYSNGTLTCSSVRSSARIAKR